MTNTITFEVTNKINYRIPEPPSMIECADNTTAVHISTLSEEQLLAIAARWTEQLLEKASVRRIYEKA